MSGIIGGAGSKSGVIGTTELDYEEGTFTPTLAASGSRAGTWSSITGKYIKIGKQVTIYFSIAGSGMYFTSDQTGYQYINNLPFTVDTSNSIELYTGSWTADSVAEGNAGTIWCMATNIYLHAAGANPNTSGVNTIAGSVAVQIP